MRVLIISGPTATGKTKLGVRLAKDLNGEIISADSMQVYRGMDIGSAKVTKEESEGVRHHMIDIIEPDQAYSIVEYKNAAKKCIEDINSRGKLPIVVGGTGFYIHALLYDTDFDENESGGELRAGLEAEMEEKGPEYMHDKLRMIDPESAEIIHMNNRKRVIRALEFYELSGKKISDHNIEERSKDSPYEFLYFAITRNRDELYKAIDDRVDRMMEAGLLDEVIALRNRGMARGLTSMQGLGYKELLDYLDGKCSLEEAVERIKQESRHYAKKQWTWLRREKDVIWVEAPVDEEKYKWILNECMKLSV